MRRKRKIITGWRLFALALLGLAAFSVFNSREIESAPLRGFYPADTEWIVCSWDFPRAWRALLHGDVIARMQDDWPRPHAPLELAARKKSGIRPTPSRWQLWMGKRVVIAGSPEGVGLTAYPGLLLRWGDALRRTFGAKPDGDGISQYGDVFYTWKDGYLLASPTRAYVTAALTATEKINLSSSDAALLTFQWAGEHPGHFHLRRGAGLPIEGEVAFDTRDGEQPLTLPQAWPETPMFSVTSRNSADAASIWGIISELTGGSETFARFQEVAVKTAEVWNVKGPRAGWDTGVDHVSLALLGIDAKSGIPIPDAVVALRYTDATPELSPFEGMLDVEGILPYEWNGCAGSMYPLLSMDFSPCVARSSREWIISTNEATMATLAGRLADGPACAAEVDIAIRLSWERFGTSADAIARWLGENQLIPGRGEADVRGSLEPEIRALSQLGELVIDGQARGPVVKFTGNLAEPTS